MSNDMTRLTCRNPELTIKRALMRRREWLINIRASPILPWSPPEPIVLRQLSDLDIHPLIRDTFERTVSLAVSIVLTRRTPKMALCLLLPLLNP